MFESVIIKEIRDSKTGTAYRVGDRVRVCLKSSQGVDRHSEFIGEILDILGDSFLLSGENLIKLKNIDKMRIAAPDESFYTHWNF